MNCQIFVSGTFVGYIQGASIEDAFEKAASILDIHNSPTPETLRVVQAGIGLNLPEKQRRFPGKEGREAK